MDRRNNGQISGFGNCLIIETPGCPPGVNGTKLYHRYLHMNSIEVNVGQQVNEGQRIGTVGNTGTEYAHLHLDTWTNRNGLGPHWNYDKDTQLASYEDAFRLIENNPNWSGSSGENGGNMQNINDDSARQIGYHYLGRNGYDGKPNALQSPQGDLQGQPLSNAKLSEFFLSAESRDWRDNRLPNLFQERDNLRGEVSRLTSTNQELTDTVARQNGEIIGLNQTINGQKLEISELSEQVKKLTAENIALKKQLEDCGSTPPPTPETDSVVITKDSLWTTFKNFISNIFKK